MDKIPGFTFGTPKPSILEQPLPIKPVESELEALKKALKNCVDLLSCSVCLERLKDTVITCTSGHLVCGNCRTCLADECPSCKDPLIPTNPVVLRKLLKAMPGFCKNSGCHEVITAKEVEDHESVCADRSISCRICNVSLKAKDLIGHSSLHSSSRFKGRSIKSSTQIDNTSTQENLNLNKIVRMWLVYDEFFWVVESVNELSNTFLVEVSWVPVKKMDFQFQGFTFGTPKPSILEQPLPIKPVESELEALKKALKNCVDLLSCSVCLERLKDTVITCTSGHLVCGNCRTCLADECPSCKDPLIPKNPVVLRKLLEAMPGFCKNSGCHEVITAKEVEDHESVCADRSISCRICNVSLKAKDLIGHSSLHSSSRFKGRSIKSSTQIDNTSTQENLNLNKIVRMWLVYDEFFWVVESVNELSNTFLVEVSWVPVKKMDFQFQVNIEIDPDSRETVCQSKQTITKFRDVVFSFSLPYLRNFMKSGGSVVHRLSISQVIKFRLNYLEIENQNHH